jgi:hypothetical protein
MEFFSPNNAFARLHTTSRRLGEDGDQPDTIRIITNGKPLYKCLGNNFNPNFAKPLVVRWSFPIFLFSFVSSPLSLNK